MPIPILAAIAAGAILGAAKNRMSAQQAAEERKRQSAITRYSPWTGMQGQSVKDPNLFGDVLQGGASGAMLGGGYNAMTAAAPAATGATTAATAGSAGTAGASGASLTAPTATSSPFSLMGSGATEASKYNLGNFASGMSAGGAGAGATGGLAGGMKMLGQGGDLMAGNSPWMTMEPDQVKGGLFDNYYAGYANQFGSK